MIQWNLQQFAGEKTEKPTPQKLLEARRKGQVAKSPELASAMVVLGAVLTMKLLAGFYIDNLIHYMQVGFSQNLSLSLTDGNARNLFMSVLLFAAKISLPVVGVVFVVGFAASWLQVGGIFTVEPITPKLEKLNPITGFKRIFSQRTLVELIKSLIKITMIGYLVYNEIIGELGRMSDLIRMETAGIMATIGDIAYAVLWKSALLLLLLALFDTLYQRYDHEKSLRMSKEEIKEEYKRTEGNPTIKGKIKERQRAMAMRRMMQEVPKADVIITNPTHYAIAIQYDAESMEAPVVLAKGVDELAQRIKQIARENGVILVENKPLAQTLYRMVEIGAAIPQELFQAVAEVLAYVYKLKRKV
jgi:flagellar biosynthetic protein FlhB